MKVSKVDVRCCKSVIKFIIGNVGQIFEKVCTVERCASLQDFFLKFLIALMQLLIDTVDFKITDWIDFILGLCDSFSNLNCARGLGIRSYSF